MRVLYTEELISSTRTICSTSFARIVAESLGFFGLGYLSRTTHHIAPCF